MLQTEKKFYSHPELFADAATVLNVQKSAAGLEVILDKTIFYPEGGGQPCDKGSIQGCLVVMVREAGKAIVHVLAAQSADFAAGDVVALQVEEARRCDHMQQHSGQHLLSGILEKDMGIHTISFHLGTEYCTIDVSTPSLSASQITEIERRSDFFIEREVPMLIHYCPPENPADFQLRKRPPAEALNGEEVLRIVEIQNYDWSPCCGTHVSHLGQVRLLRILAAEKYKGNTRIYFAAGNRAVQHLRRQHETLKSLAGRLGTSVDEADERVAALLRKSSALESAKKLLVSQRARLEVSMAIQEAAERGEQLKLLFLRSDDRDADEVLETVKAAQNASLDVIVFSVPAKTVIAARSPDASWDVASCAKPLLGEFEGKGGGSASLFRAVFQDGAKAEAYAAVLRECAIGTEIQRISFNPSNSSRNSEFLL